MYIYRIGRYTRPGGERERGDLTRSNLNYSYIRKREKERGKKKKRKIR